MLMAACLSCNVCTHLTRHFCDLIQSFCLEEKKRKNTLYTVLEYRTQRATFSTLKDTRKYCII